MDWRDIWRYWCQEADRDAGIQDMLILAGNANNAIATSCGDYVKRTWPASISVLPVIQDAMYGQVASATGM